MKLLLTVEPSAVEKGKLNVSVHHRARLLVAAEIDDQGRYLVTARNDEGAMAVFATEDEPQGVPAAVSEARAACIRIAMGTAWFAVGGDALATVGD